MLNDDGFRIGQCTTSGTLALLVTTTLLGVFGYERIITEKCSDRTIRCGSSTGGVLRCPPAVG